MLFFPFSGTDFRSVFADTSLFSHADSGRKQDAPPPQCRMLQVKGHSNCIPFLQTQLSGDDSCLYLGLLNILPENKQTKHTFIKAA